MAAYHSTSSLADHAPLGLDTFEPVACDRIDPTVKTDADPIPAAPTGRNLIAKGVSPGTTEQPFFGPEGDESTAGIERIDVDGINPTFNCYSTTIHVREGVHRKRNLLMSAFLVRYVGPNSRRCVPFRAEKRVVPYTRAHALRWLITPLWGWIHLNLQVVIESTRR